MDDTGTKGKSTHHLTVVEGGREDSPRQGTESNDKLPKGKVEPLPKGKVGFAESGLTLKQEAFAMGLAEGLTNSEAYRRAYRAEGMKPAILHSEASRQASHPKVAARVAELMAEKRRGKQHVAERINDRVWRNVWKLAEGDDVPPAVKATALNLAAKMAGMLTDKVEIKQETGTKELERELKERLAKYGVG